MNHRDLAELAAVLGAVGALLALVPRARWGVVAGLALLTAAEVGLGVALVPSSDFDALVASAPRVVALLVAAGAVVAVALAFVRWPAAVPVALVVTAPFRVPVHVGAQKAFLLMPLYVVLAGAVLALVARVLRGERPAALPGALAGATAAFVALDAVSLFWALDRRPGSIELAFFIFPFTALLAVVARSPLPSWLPRALGTAVVVLAAGFAAIGLWQLRSHDLFFARDVEATNAYSSFFRVTSVFKDPSIYGRQLVLGIAVLLVALWLRRVRLALAALAIGFLWLGLFFSYSQSSMIALAVVAVVVTLVAAEKRDRVAVAVVSAAMVIGAAGFVAATAEGHPLRRLTSGRSRLVDVTWTVVKNHPFAGVGVGSQPAASRREASPGTATRKNASHATPLTVAAELGVLGIAAYLAFLGAVVAVLLRVRRLDFPLALGVGAVFVALVVHSFFYSGFFEDPITWGLAGLAAAFLATRPEPRVGAGVAAAPPLPQGERGSASALTRRY